MLTEFVLIGENLNWYHGLAWGLAVHHRLLIVQTQKGKLYTLHLALRVLLYSFVGAQEAFVGCQMMVKDNMDGKGQGKGRRAHVTNKWMDGGYTVVFCLCCFISLLG